MKKILVIIIMLMVLSIALWDESYARPGISYSGPSGQPHPPVIPHMQQPTKAQSFAKHTTMDVYNLLLRNDLTEQLITESKKEIVFKYLGFTGHICAFYNENDLYKAQEKTLDMNESGESNTWSFAQDNILIVLDGKLPIEEFLKFQEVIRR